MPGSGPELTEMMLSLRCSTNVSSRLRSTASRPPAIAVNPLPPGVIVGMFVNISRLSFKLSGMTFGAGPWVCRYHNLAATLF